MIELAPTSEKPMAYDEALLYCQFCNHNNHKDWRMCTVSEYLFTGKIIGWYTRTTGTVDRKELVTPVRTC
jgi:hypothetical protein